MTATSLLTTTAQRLLHFQCPACRVCLHVGKRSFHTVLLEMVLEAEKAKGSSERQLCFIISVGSSGPCWRRRAEPWSSSKPFLPSSLGWTLYPAPRGFSIIHLNAHSLYSHLNELVAFVLPRVPDVVVSETWLDESISSVHLAIPGYQLFRQDRNKHGGGGAVYVSESLVTKVCSCACDASGLEYICLEIFGIHLSSPVYLTCLYHPPSASTSSGTKLLDLTEKALIDHRLVIACGDLNIDVSSDCHPFSRLLLNFISNHSLQQPITSLIHVSSTSASVLNLFLTSPNNPI